MLTPLQQEMSDVADLSHETRRFRSVLRSFERNLELLFRDAPLSLEVDHAALATAFANWRQRFDASKHLANINRTDFVIFAAGLMLKELIAAAPVKTVEKPSVLPAIQDALANHALASWPEGYAYTSYCLSVASAILHEDGGFDLDHEQASDDPAFWASFKENVAENPALAVAFFDRVCGREPNWDAPDVPWMRKAMSEAKLIP